MSTLTENQVQIISNLLIDNGLIAGEAKENPSLEYYPDFVIELQWAICNCYSLYMDVLNNKVNEELVLNRITSILNKLSQYRDKYIDYESNTVGNLMFRYMNSLFDKTSESFEEFFNTL